MACITSGSGGVSRPLSVIDTAVVGMPAKGDFGAPPPACTRSFDSARCFTGLSSGTSVRAASARAAADDTLTEGGVVCAATGDAHSPPHISTDTAQIFSRSCMVRSCLSRWSHYITTGSAMEAIPADRSWPGCPVRPTS